MNFEWDDNKNNLNEKDLKKQSRTDWAKLEAMTDEEIDVSDIPPLDEKFFANVKLRMPKGKVSILLNVDEETNDWYESQGEEAKELMTVALKIYAEAHRETSSPVIWCDGKCFAQVLLVNNMLIQSKLKFEEDKTMSKKVKFEEQYSF